MSSDYGGHGFGSFLGMFAVGAAAGAAIALLTAPRSGRETRARLKGAALKMGEKLQQVPGALQKAGQAVLAHAKQEVVDASRDHKGYVPGNEVPRFTR
jgi:gas vesicle protein